MPVQQHTTAWSARPSLTSRAAESEAHAQSSRSSALARRAGDTAAARAQEFHDPLRHPVQAVGRYRNPHGSRCTRACRQARVGAQARQAVVAVEPVALRMAAVGG